MFPGRSGILPTPHLLRQCQPTFSARGYMNNRAFYKSLLPTLPNSPALIDKLLAARTSRTLASIRSQRILSVRALTPMSCALRSTVANADSKDLPSVSRSDDHTFRRPSKRNNDLPLQSPTTLWMASSCTIRVAVYLHRDWKPRTNKEEGSTGTTGVTAPKGGDLRCSGSTSTTWSHIESAYSLVPSMHQCIHPTV